MSRGIAESETDNETDTGREAVSETDNETERQRRSE